MECSYWLLVTFAFLFLLPVQGHEACYEDSWAYHNLTHTCFKLFEIGSTWTEARDHCSQVQLGSTYGVTTRLAKIDDEQTNEFIITLFPNTHWSCWIGLHYNIDKQALRWDGYPDEPPRYIASHWIDLDLPCMSILQNAWRGWECDLIHHFVCQHSAKKIPAIVCQHDIQSYTLNITCTSHASPIEANCQWTHKYDGQSSFPAWQSIDNLSHESNTQNTGGNISFTTACWTTLSYLNPGNLTVKMQMYPDISGTDLSTTPEAVTEVSIDINIETPDNPIFSLSPNEPITGPDVILVQGSNVNLTCSINTGNPAVYGTTMPCQDHINAVAKIGTIASQQYKLIIQPIRRDMDGKECYCWGNHVTGNTTRSTLTFIVVTKPTSVVCNSILSPTSLQVSCQTDEIYPQALCEFSYAQENEQNFNPVSATIYTHESYTDSNGTLHFKSNCSMTLTPSNMTFRPGNLTVQVTMNPDQEGIDQDTTPEAFYTTQEIVNIEVPNKPQFKMHDKIVQTSSPIHFNENDTIHLSCEIQSGKPTVHSVTMSCEFPFTDADGDNRHTVPGTTYVMDENASRDMNRKNCSCIGYHLTGPIESSPLTFNVTYPADVKSFTVNVDYSQAEVDLNDSLTLSCMADGNPAPSVTIQKLESSYLDTSTWRYDQSGGDTVVKELTLTAECVHNGRYRCSVTNQLGAQMAEVDIHVRCPPTYCNGASSGDQQLAARPGRSQSMSLCVVAYPMPDFRLLKKTEIGWSPLPDFDGQISNVTKFESQQRVTIDFLALDSSHLGQYALSYSSESCSPCSVLYFQLTAPLTACNPEIKEDHKVFLGQTVIVSICATAFPSPSHLVMQKAMKYSWHDCIYANFTILLDVDFDTLVNVRITFMEVEELDLGEYRLFDPQKASGSASSYPTFSLSNAQLKDQASSSSLSTGTIIGLILASNFVVVILTILSMVAFRKLRSGNIQKTSQTKRDGVTNAEFHTPEEETHDSGYVEVSEQAPDSGYVDVSDQAPDSGYVDVSQHSSFPETTSPPLPLHNKQSNTGVYVGEEMQDIDTSKNVDIDEVDERGNKGLYDTIHPDDAKYVNLNRDPLRKYITISPGDTGTSGVYHDPI